MEQSIVGAIAQSGAFGAMLCAVLYWLARYYLPERERASRDALERIVSAHSTAIERLTLAHESTAAGLGAALERNTRTLALNSQALLVQSLTRSGRGGLSREELEGLVRRLDPSTTAVDTDVVEAERKAA